MHWQLADVNDPFYYWHNFDVMRRWVETHHHDLLSARQQQVLAQYQSLPRDAQCLWLRLFMRKGALFRADRLSYAELNVPFALDILEQYHWLEPVTVPNKDSLRLFTVAELRRFYGAAKAATDKKTLVNELSATASELPAAVLQLQRNDDFNELSILFFGNSHQQISEFVVAALGHVNYEHYRIRPRSVFPDTATFQRFCQLESVQRDYKALETLDERVELARYLQRDSIIREVPSRLEGKANRLINRIARDCERAGELELALNLYQQSQRPPSRERQARILQKADSHACYALLVSMLENPWDASEKEVALRLLTRWFKLNRQDKSAEIPTKNVTLAFKPRQVEQAALSYYHERGWQGVHAENVIVQALFGLVFWDIIFADVNGAFIHPFQRGPRDLSSPSFYRQRRALIQRRLKSLVCYPDAIKARIKRVLLSKHGIANPFVPWKWQQLNEVVNWFERIPVTTWQHIFEQLAFDVKNNRSGFPDLWLYQDGEVKLVEVKGPGDALRPNQEQWLRRLAKCGLNIEILHVSLESPSTEQ